MKGLVLARHTAEIAGAAARGRVAGLEAACEAGASQIEMLTAHLTAARHSKVRPTAYTPHSMPLVRIRPLHCDTVWPDQGHREVEVATCLTKPQCCALHTKPRDACPGS